MRVENKKFNNTLHDVSVQRKRDRIKIVGDDETISIPLPDGLPEYVCLPKAEMVSGATVRTNGQGDMLYSIYPTSKTYYARFKKFTAKPGELPSPRTIPGKDMPKKTGGSWFKPEHMGFTAILEVTKGDWKGAEIPLFMDYIFMRDRDGSAFMSGSKKMVETITTFLELCGFDIAQESIKYSENILPDLEQILSERADDHVFLVTMEKGYLKTMSEIPAGEEDDEDEKPKKRKVDDDDSPFAEPKAKSKRVVEDDEDEDDEPVRPAKRKVWRDD